jgi:hypothetical protein
MDNFELKQVKASFNGIFLSFLLGIAPVMEYIDRLNYNIHRKKKTDNKYLTDLQYLKHETELIEMDLRVFELLTKKT